MPSGASSVAIVFDQPTIALRSEFDSPNDGIGATTPEEVLVTVESQADFDVETDGRFVVYSGAEVGPSFDVRAVTADGRPVELPRPPVY